MTSLYKLNNVSFNYGSDFSLSNVNLDIENEKITALVGPNGSGKTSLLNLLSFLFLPNSGQIEYEQQHLDKSSQEKFKKTVGYVQQNPYLLRGSVRRNIELGLRLRHLDKGVRQNRVNDVIKLMDITELSDRNARELSGGESQKVAIAQVLVLQPKVLVLDEPFAHLDKRSIDDLENLIIKLKNDFKITIILTTHNQYQAQRLANYVYSVMSGIVSETQLVNLFSGVLDVPNMIFNTGKQKITLSDGDERVEHIAIDPKQIVLSNEKLDSSMQNSYQGKITAMVEQNGEVNVSINVGESYHAIISHRAMDELDLKIGRDVWISFKSTSILLL